MKAHFRNILTLEQARKIIARLRRQGKKIVLTNGCFDLLHAGHLACLKFAKAQGDILVVAVNDDLSVRRLKGKSRPIIGERFRAALLSELKPVDFVVPFGHENAAPLVKALKPDVYVKGEEYNLMDTPEGIETVKYGGRVQASPLVPHLSTTAIIKKIKQNGG